jgi:2-methylcitrate dehydratase PrpD
LDDIGKIISSKYSKIDYCSLPDNLINITKKFILDSIGTSLAGTCAPGCKEIVKLFTELGGSKESSLIGFNEKLTSTAAAFINSMSMHALDFDDTYDPAAMHCYTSVLPAALALAESRGNVSGKELINAAALGVDLCARLGVAINSPLSWIRTATCGSFAAALTACKILNLDKEKILNAFGIVYSQTSGNAQCLIDGGLAKRMQPAFAARAGVLSALMSELDLTGAKDVFEGKFGFFNLYERGDYNRFKCLENLGNEFYGTKLSIKPYPCCRMTHASIDAALYIKENYKVTATEIEKIELYTSKMVKDMVGNSFKIRESPQVDAQFSIPYTVSVTLCKGKPFINDFYDHNVRSSENRCLADKINVITDNELDQRDIKSASIKLYLNSGNIIRQKINVFKGNPDNPLSDIECIEKFKKCANFGLKKFTQGELEQLIYKLLNLEKIKDISEITCLLR